MQQSNRQVGGRTEPNRLFLAQLQQRGALLDDPQLSFGQELSVAVGDSSYSKPGYLYAHRRHRNLVTIVRAKGNRIFYHQFQPEVEPVKSAGHPTWYGRRSACPSRRGGALRMPP